MDATVARNQASWRDRVAKRRRHCYWSFRQRPQSCCCDKINVAPAGQATPYQIDRLCPDPAVESSSTCSTVLARFVWRLNESDIAHSPTTIAVPLTGWARVCVSSLRRNPVTCGSMAVRRSGQQRTTDPQSRLGLAIIGRSVLIPAAHR